MNKRPATICMVARAIHVVAKAIRMYGFTVYGCLQYVVAKAIHVYRFTVYGCLQCMVAKAIHMFTVCGCQRHTRVRIYSVSAVFSRKAFVHTVICTYNHTYVRSCTMGV